MAERRTTRLTLPDDVAMSDLFRIARVTARMRPRDAASRLGLSLSTYQRIEDGTRKARDGEVIAFAAITGQDSAFFEAASNEHEPRVVAAEPVRT